MTNCTRLLCCLLLLLPASLSAQPLVFARDTLTIVTTQEVPVNAEEEDTEKQDEEAEDAEEEEETIIQQVEYPVTVDIRPQSALNLEWFHSLENIKNSRGVLVTIDDEDALSLQWANIYAEVDILFLHPSGNIQAIAPSIVPAELREGFSVKGPVAALLYLGAGAAEAHNIKPGDTVRHSMFSPKPVVLQ